MEGLRTYNIRRRSWRQTVARRKGFLPLLVLAWIALTLLGPYQVVYAFTAIVSHGHIVPSLSSFVPRQAQLVRQAQSSSTHVPLRDDADDDAVVIKQHREEMEGAAGNGAGREGSDERLERERIKRDRIAKRQARHSLPLSASSSSSMSIIYSLSGLPPLPQSSSSSSKGGRFLPTVSRACSSSMVKAGGGEGRGRHTVDLYVPRTDLEVMMAWADRLEEVRHPQLVLADKEQRLLALAQMFLRMEKLRLDLSEGKPLGSITPRQLASQLGLKTEEVEAFYKLGLRARSYILMSMNSIIMALANKYSAAFGVDQAELTQEGYKGVLMAVERYDPVKAAATGATFRAFAYVYVMSSMITAAKNELHLTPAATPRDPAMMRLPSGEEPEGRLSLPKRISEVKNHIQRLGPGTAASVEEVEVYNNYDDEAEDDWEDDEEEDLEEALEKEEERRMATKKRKSRAPRVRKITRMLPGHEAAVEGRRGGRELFGIDPEANRPAYEILDEGKHAKDVGVFLSRAAKELSPLDMEVLSLVYGLKGGIPMKRAQVARKLGLHASAVSKSEKRALRKLREMLEIA